MLYSWMFMKVYEIESERKREMSDVEGLEGGRGRLGGGVPLFRTVMTTAKLVI